MGFVFWISSCDEALSWRGGLSANLRGKEVDRGLDIMAGGDLIERGTHRKKVMMRYNFWRSDTISKQDVDLINESDDGITVRYPQPAHFGRYGMDDALARCRKFRSFH